MWQCNFAGFFDIFRITKCGKVILLQSVTDCYYKVRKVLQNVTDCYYKVRQALQSVTVITKWDAAPSNCTFLDEYLKSILTDSFEGYWNCESLSALFLCKEKPRKFLIPA